jgi:hypothetical protein
VSHGYQRLKSSSPQPLKFSKISTRAKVYHAETDGRTRGGYGRAAQGRGMEIGPRRQYLRRAHEQGWPERSDAGDMMEGKVSTGS